MDTASIPLHLTLDQFRVLREVVAKGNGYLGGLAKTNKKSRSSRRNALKASKVKQARLKNAA